VEEEKSGKINRYLASLSSDKSSLDAGCFAVADDLNEAAGALMGNCVGSNVGTFFDALCEGFPAFLKEKIEMMVKGKCSGVRMYKDAESWIPSKVRSNNLFLKNYKGLKLTAEEWVELLPRLSLTFVSRVMKGKIAEYA